MRWSKVPKIDRKFHKTSENGALEELYNSITFVRMFFLNTTFTFTPCRFVQDFTSIASHVPEVSR